MAHITSSWTQLWLTSPAVVPNYGSHHQQLDLSMAHITSSRTQLWLTSPVVGPNYGSHHQQLDLSMAHITSSWTQLWLTSPAVGPNYGSHHQKLEICPWDGRGVLSYTYDKLPSSKVREVLSGEGDRYRYSKVSWHTCKEKRP